MFRFFILIQEKQMQENIHPLLYGGFSCQKEDVVPCLCSDDLVGVPWEVWVRETPTWKSQCQVKMDFELGLMHLNQSIFVRLNFPFFSGASSMEGGFSHQRLSLSPLEIIWDLNSVLLEWQLLFNRRLQKHGIWTLYTQCESFAAFVRSLAP